jgi:hypothetical protein
MSNKIELINSLFNKISFYEDDPISFSSSEFQENFVGLLAMFEAEEDKVVDSQEVDRILSRRIIQFDIHRSDLRKLSLHLLTMYYKYLANVPHPMDRAYVLCREKRRPKNDAAYLMDELVPLVFKPGSLKNDFEFKYFFLERIAVFQSKFGGAPPLFDTLSLAEIKIIPKSTLLLGLLRRWLSNTGLVLREGTIENKCQQSGYFSSLGREDRFFRYILEKLEYYQQIPFYRKLWMVLKRGSRRILSVFSSLNFFVYLFTRRNMAYFLYLLLIVLFAWVSFMVPRWWKNFNNKKLRELRRAQASQVDFSHSYRLPPGSTDGESRL